LGAPPLEHAAHTYVAIYLELLLILLLLLEYRRAAREASQI
jgi:hypothetical protein